jgi:flagellar biosynthesis component FlhA
MNRLMLTLRTRLREPSTMAGLSALLVLFGVPPGVPELAGQVIAGLAGLAAVFLPEAGK